jgi:hypothetical protein
MQIFHQIRKKNIDILLLLKSLYQAQKVSGRVSILCVKGIDFASFYDFSIGFLDLVRQSVISPLLF